MYEFSRQILRSLLIIIGGKYVEFVTLIHSSTKMIPLHHSFLDGFILYENIFSTVNLFK